MRCVYINLAGATQRRAHMEAEFARAAPAGVTLERFEAVDAAAAASAPGQARPPEKACFLSHRNAIAAHHDGESPLLVLEDDVLLSPQAFTADRLAGGDWDLMFLDAALADPGTWLRFAKGRPALARQGGIRVVDLATIRFASASAYVVNARSKARVLEVLDEARPLDLPYDIVLRQLIQAGRLKACMTFPFLTSIAAFSDVASQIQAGQNDADRISNTFRRLMFVGRDMAASRVEAEAIAGEADEESQLMGMILAGVVSDRFGPK